MILRRPTPEELPRLRELHKQRDNEFKFPDIELLSSIYVVCDDDNKILGFGAIQPIFEAIIVLDEKLGMDTRLMSFNQLLARADHEMKSQGIDSLHAFVQDRKFYNLLKNKYDFKDTKGRALVRTYDK